MTWYVVFRGRRPGVYQDWATCNDQVCGYSNSSYRGYATREEAIRSYRAYFGKGDEGINRYQGESSGEHALPIQESAAERVGAGRANDPAEAVAPGEPDLVPLVLALVAILIAMVAYLVN